jgi:hypothetical protein
LQCFSQARRQLEVELPARLIQEVASCCAASLEIILDGHHDRALDHDGLPGNVGWLAAGDARPTATANTIAWA